MLFAIHALDRPNEPERRMQHYEAHISFSKASAEFGVKMVVSGPLVADDGVGMLGSLMIVEAPYRAAVEKFNGSDPFSKAGVWDKVTITAFLKRVG